MSKDQNPAPSQHLTAEQQRVLADPCVQKLEEGEPFFVLLGRDPDAAVALHAWIDARRDREGDSEKLTSAETTYWKFGDWQREVEDCAALASEGQA